MELERIHVRSSPGLLGGLPEVEFPAGFVLVVGPNGSGKSTLLRTMHTILWPEVRSSRTVASARWCTSSGTHTAELHSGRVTWEPPLPVAIPPGAAVLARFGLPTLLDAGDDGDHELAARLARELAGGLDISAALTGFGTPERLSASRSLARELKTSRKALREANSCADDLAARETRLQRLQEEIREAQAAQRMLAAAKALGEVVEAARGQSELEARQAVFPEGLDALRGDEATRIEGLTERLSGLQLNLETLSAEIREEQRLRDKAAFSGDPPAEDDVETWTGRVADLGATESEIRRLSGELEAAQRKRDSARKRIVSDSDPEGLKVSDSALNTLAARLDSYREASARAAAVSESAAHWAAWAEGGDVDPRPLLETISALRAWLRASRQLAAPSRRWPAWTASLLLVVGLLCLGVAYVLGQPWWASGLVLAGVGAGLLLARSGTTAGRGAGENASQQLVAEQAGLSPANWQVETVDSHLRDLEARLESWELARRAQGRALEAQQKAELCQRTCEQHEGELREAARAIGVTGEFVELGAIQQGQAIVEWAEALSALGEIEAKLETAKGCVEQVLAGLCQWLEMLGVSAPPDVAAARVAVRGVAGRLAQWHGALRALENKKGEDLRVRKIVQEVEADCQAVWRRAGVAQGDLSDLERRLELLADWREHRRDKTAADARLAAARVRLGHEVELEELAGRDPAEVSSGEVDDWSRAYSNRADVLGGLQQEVGGIREALAAATRGSSVADALARAREVEAEVAIEWERAAEDAVARMLIESARDSHENANAPPVLKRAQSLFQRFTHDGWRIEVDRDGEFCALDVAMGQVKRLAALSDATRAQLLLAARIAALQEIELASEPLPICLDEALSNCDPARFREIAGALLELVADGRQVIYVTADPSEAEQWRQVCRQLGRPLPETIDLAVLRNADHDWGGELPAVPAVVDWVPDPARMAADEYARAVGAAPPNGHLEVASWHLYIVAQDDLDALARCLRRRIATTGVWVAARRAGHTPDGISPETAQRFDARCKLLAPIVEAWRIGRGRQLTWEDIAGSGAVSETFEERVRELFRRHTAEPSRFMERVDALKGFRTARADDLRAHLENLGVLPTVNPLANGELVQHAFARAPDALEVLGPEVAGGYLDWVLTLLREGEMSARPVESL